MSSHPRALSRTILAETSPGETRWALLEDDLVVEVVHQRAERPLWGDFVAGRIGQRVPGHEAAFVYVGAGPSGFLPQDTSTQVLLPSEGTLLLLQVKREAVGTKGPKLAVVKNVPTSVVAAFRTMGKPGLLPDTFGVLRRWLGDSGQSDVEVIVDDGTLLNGIRRAFGARRAVQISYTRNRSPLFEVFGVEEALEQALSGSVRLPEGGMIHFGQTEALTAIDVDAGATPGPDVSRAAIPELVRQFRLRALGGQILVDFPRNRRGLDPKVLSLVKQALGGDSGGARLLGATRGGLLEIVRPRMHTPLADLLLERHTVIRPTPETALLGVLRTLSRGSTGARFAVIEVMSVAVGRLLELPAYREALYTAQGRCGLAVRVEHRAVSADLSGDDPVRLTFG